MYWWDLSGQEPQSKRFAVAFYRDACDDDQRVGVRLATDSLDADDIAAAVEEALDLPFEPSEEDGVHALLLCSGTSVAINSPRLNSVGAALLERARHIS